MSVHQDQAVQYEVHVQEVAFRSHWGNMNTQASRIGLLIAACATAMSVAACGGSSSSSSSAVDAEVDAFMEELEERIPTRERASVRVCEELVATPLTTQEEALAFVTWGLSELESSDDPRGMFVALSTALISAGDALMLGDAQAYEDAAIDVATTCVDIMSGEYGK